MAGGSSVTIADAPNPRGGVWLPDDTILYSPMYATGLWRIPVSGGVAEEVLEIDEERGERTLRFPHATPDGEIVLFTVGSTKNPNNYEDANIDVYSFGHRRASDRDRARHHGPVCRSRSDRLCPARRSLRHRFRSRSLEVVGEPVPVIEDVGGDPSSGAGYFTIADNGSIAWLAGAVTAADALLTIVD